jgi:hypothetical protein
LVLHIPGSRFFGVTILNLGSSHTIIFFPLVVSA